MSKQNTRDTQFAGFAKLLLKELQKSNAFDLLDANKFWSDENISEVETIIAQRTYDLLFYQIESTYEHRGTFVKKTHRSVRMMPDMNEWPDKQ